MLWFIALLCSSQGLICMSFTVCTPGAEAQKLFLLLQHLFSQLVFFSIYDIDYQYGWRTFSASTWMELVGHLSNKRLFL